MKHKILIIAGLALFFSVVTYIAHDLFSNSSVKYSKSNPYEYDIQHLNKFDSVSVSYNENLAFRPQMLEMHGVATDYSDRIYVAGNKFLEIFTKTGNLLKRIALDGNALCITIDPDKNILLGMEDRIEILDMDGKLKEKWEPVSQSSIITSISSDGKNVFVADAGLTSVYQYDISGKLIGHIGDKDPHRGIPGFVVPSPYFDLGISGINEFWVANPGRHLMEKFDFEGNLIKSWGITSMEIEGFCGCCNPSHFTILKDGSFVTSEKGIERVKIYTSEGKLKCVVALPQSFKEGTRGLDLCVDSKDRIIVLDPVKKMVRVFAPNIDSKNNN